MRYGVAALLFAAVVVAAVFTVPPAGAKPPFLDQFKAMYVKPNSKDRTAEIFKEAVEAKKCTICHGAKSKKTFNAYGLQVKKLLSKNDVGNATKIKSALAKVSRVKSDAGETYGERLRAGKLPVGEIHVRGGADSQ